jgi:hypothetical protein
VGSDNLHFIFINFLTLWFFNFRFLLVRIIIADIFVTEVIVAMTMIAQTGTLIIFVIRLKVPAKVIGIILSTPLAYSQILLLCWSMLLSLQLLACPMIFTCNKPISL